jgi:hypothetical protein
MIFDITTSNKTTIKTENFELNTVYDKRNYSLDTTADTNVPWVIEVDKVPD